MKSFPTVVLLVALVSGCTPSSETTHLMLPQDTPMATPQIAVLESVPAGAVVLGTVTADSCSRKIGMPPPSPEAALASLKVKAASQAATGVAAVSYKEGGLDYGKNCWASITASGTAYR